MVGPELLTLLKVRLHQGWIQQDNHFSWLAGDAVFDAPQDEVCPLGCQGTHTADPIELPANQHSQNSAPVQTHVWDYSIPGAESSIWLILLSFMSLAQYSNQSKSLCKAKPLVPRESQQHFLVWLSSPVHSTAISRSLIKRLNRAASRAERWGTSLVTDHQPDVLFTALQFEPCSSTSSSSALPTCSSCCWKTCLEEC